MPETGYLRYFLTVFFVVFLLWCVGIATGDGSGMIQPPPDNTTDVRVIILLDTPPAPATEGTQNAAGVPARALSLETGDQPEQVISELERMDATEIRDLPMFNAVSCQISSSEVETLKEMPGVARVVPDRVIQLLEDRAGDQQEPGNTAEPAATPFDGGGGSGTAWGVNRIGAPSVWEYGINGSGINVSVVDTGINAIHPDLAGRVIAWKDLVNNQPGPYDDYFTGHGTHVAGTIAGTGAGGTKTGVAPGANLIVVKVFDGTGSALTSTVMAGFQWSADHGADIISFSGGSNDIDFLLQERDITVGAGTPTIQPVNVLQWFKDDTSFRPASVAIKLTSPDLYDLNITLYRPDGTVQPGSPMTWFSPGTSDWYYQYIDETAPLASGAWNLTITKPGPVGNHLWYSGTGMGTTLLTNYDIDLSNVTNASLQFLNRYDLDARGNSGYVEISSTNPESWQVVGTFTGRSARHEEEVDLSPFTGHHVMLRFRLNVLYTQYSGGWYLDNISIPAIGYTDTVENGTGNWTTVSWTNVTDQSTGHIHEIVVNYADDGTSPDALIADSLSADGVLMVIAAGNRGTPYVPLSLKDRTIASPGSAHDAVTVGATAETGDAIAGFSSRGPVGYGANMVNKPDVVAPGVNIMSTSRYLGYVTMNGTSMATPHVAGTAALMLQADPSLTPARIKAIMGRTAVDLGEPGPDISYGAGRVDARAAVFNVTGWDMMRGDINNNGRTDIGDVVFVSYMAAGLSAPDGAADYNHNRLVDAGDAAKIAWYYVGKTPAL